ncbi:MAG: tRNA (adenosine(37)-N6)-threonylcarbamoyltransferase complex ATPase subunit type 1 TsaE [Pseudomonadota bacterium]
MAAPRTLHLPDADDTDAVAQAIAARLRPGDCLLLDGPVGAGKTAFARAAILARLATAGRPPEDVPSPTFTLVQTYDAGAFEIWHADLYRLTDPSDVLELGLDDALRDAVCLIEWPDRLGPDAPADALRLSFQPTDPGRTLTVTGPPDRLDRLLPQPLETR